MSGNTHGEGFRNPIVAGISRLPYWQRCPPHAPFPSFARQTGMACEACHTVYPELTHFGRVFTPNGYILTNVKQVRDVTGKKEELASFQSNMRKVAIMYGVAQNLHRPEMESVAAFLEAQP
jgi:hypothetical protein